MGVGKEGESQVARASSEEPLTQEREQPRGSGMCCSTTQKNVQE